MQNATTLKRFPSALIALVLIALIIIAVVLASGALNLGALSPATANSAQPNSSLNVSNSVVAPSSANTVDMTVAGNRER